ncbi:unnamed protein product [Fusarium venenatum]|uniref:Uncharacterized protein n=1 Tax=Fusarium venenatum TaxID=56646 RepID=A0A2L2T2K6_9HYPO|nr:uncharacterized protein FVRRES_12090 [Fusarium venenatum]CEI39399.1 unnamed protein product [Fusarium venenatum]
MPVLEEANDLARDVLAAGLLVVHDTGGGGEDDVAELTGREQLDNPLLELGEADVVAGRDNSDLVETAVELNNDLAGSVIVDLFELANTIGIHHEKDSEKRGLSRGAVSTVALVIMPNDGGRRVFEDIWWLDHAVSLHDSEELDDDLGRRSDQDLALASLLGVVHGVKRIVEDGSADHFCGVLRRFSSRDGEMRYLTKVRVSLSRAFERGECPQRSIARVLPPSAEEKRIKDTVASL